MVPRADRSSASELADAVRIGELLGGYWIGSDLPKYSATLRLISTLWLSSSE